MMNKQDYLKTLNIDEIRNQILDNFSKLAVVKTDAKTARETLESVRAAKSMQENNLMLATHEDGTSLINGKNQTIRDAQVKEQLQIIIGEHQEQEKKYRDAQFEVELVQDKISMLRKLVSLITAELNYLGAD